jgi:peroxiredoxin
MKLSRRLVPLAIVLLVGLMGWLWLPSFTPEPGPDITLSSIDGRAVSLKQLHGRPVLVTFWASTCPGCLKEIPHLAELYRELSPQGLEVIGIAMHYDPPNRVLSVHRSQNIPYTVALDIQADASRAFGDVRMTPTSFLIDPDGQIVYRNSGMMNMGKVRRKILEMIAKHKRPAPESGTGKTG